MWKPKPPKSKKKNILSECDESASNKTKSKKVDYDNITKTAYYGSEPDVNTDYERFLSETSQKWSVSQSEFSETDYNNYYYNNINQVNQVNQFNQVNP